MIPDLSDPEVLERAARQWGYAAMNNHEHPLLDDMTLDDTAACDECALIAHDACCITCADAHLDITDPTIARSHLADFDDNCDMPN